MFALLLFLVGVLGFTSAGLLDHVLRLKRRAAERAMADHEFRVSAATRIAWLEAQFAKRAQSGGRPNEGALGAILRNKVKEIHEGGSAEPLADPSHVFEDRRVPRYS